jgi:hypothetical protein
MALTVEAIVGIVFLFVTCPPALIIIWKLYRRHGSSDQRPRKSVPKSWAHLPSPIFLKTKIIDKAYELGVLPATNSPSPQGHLAYYMFTERRVDPRVVSSYYQLCKVT